MGRLEIGKEGVGVCGWEPRRQVNGRLGRVGATPENTFTANFLTFGRRGFVNSARVERLLNLVTCDS